MTKHPKQYSEEIKFKGDNENLMLNFIEIKYKNSEYAYMLQTTRINLKQILRKS